MMMWANFRMAIMSDDTAVIVHPLARPARLKITEGRFEIVEIDPDEEYRMNEKGEIPYE